MEKHLKAATILANLLDNNFSFLGKRFGLNGLLGLIPWVGDLVVFGLSLHMIWLAFQLKVPLNKISLMIWNVLANFVLGLVPILGDYLDFFTHVNIKNLRIIQEHIDRNHIIIQQASLN